MRVSARASEHVQASIYMCFCVYIYLYPLCVCACKRARVRERGILTYRSIPFRSPGKYPAPEQLANPVMFSYQGRGRPRKNWTHATVRGVYGCVWVCDVSVSACVSVFLLYTLSFTVYLYPSLLYTFSLSLYLCVSLSCQ